MSAQRQRKRRKGTGNFYSAMCARELQADHFVDQIVEISDALEQDPKSRQVRFAAPIWVAAVRRSKVYGKTPGVSVNVAAGVVLTEEKQKELQKRHRKALERFRLSAPG